MSRTIINKTNFVGYLENRAHTQSEQAAFIFLADGEQEKSRLTYAQLHSQAQIIATHLQKYAQIGDRILLCYVGFSLNIM